ncbi:MipA/OmpV family protein [Altererythrobacter sp. MF3-039]|uniref:MipA/OmpV family protein n=1 Tax=Altererythrobacter sp. MF3-039 TaxID=3252901 RepID=UPI00390C9EC9
MNSALRLALFAALPFLAQPAFAQEDQQAEGLFARSDRGEEGSVYDDTWLAVGFGARLGPSYPGSDDTEFNAFPVIAGSINNIDFTPRAAGLAVDVFQFDIAPNVRIDGGPVGRVRFTRTGGFKDPVVEAAGKLDEAVELGAQFGVTFKRIFSQYDRISIGADIRWDVAGAHGGMIFDPGISYRTPLSRGVLVSASAGADYASDGFSDYYFSVNPQQAADSGLPLYTADGGWYKAGGSLGLAVDLDGNAENGGLIFGVLGSYSRMLGDGGDTPFTNIRGERDQWSLAGGLGYVF